MGCRASGLPRRPSLDPVRKSSIMPGIFLNSGVLALGSLGIRVQDFPGLKLWRGVVLLLKWDPGLTVGGERV